MYTQRMLSYNKLKDRPRDFLAATSLTLEEFQQWLPALQSAYEQRYPYELTHAGKPRQRVLSQIFLRGHVRYDLPP